VRWQMIFLKQAIGDVYRAIQCRKAEKRREIKAESQR
jgi:hypothetical protein